MSESLNVGAISATVRLRTIDALVNLDAFSPEGLVTALGFATDPHLVDFDSYAAAPIAAQRERLEATIAAKLEALTNVPAAQWLAIYTLADVPADASSLFDGGQ